jgi:hypothetical protein
MCMPQVDRATRWRRLLPCLPAACSEHVRLDSRVHLVTCRTPVSLKANASHLLLMAHTVRFIAGWRAFCRPGMGASGVWCVYTRGWLGGAGDPQSMQARAATVLNNLMPRALCMPSTHMHARPHSHMQGGSNNAAHTIARLRVCRA